MQPSAEQKKIISNLKIDFNKLFIANGSDIVRLIGFYGDAEDNFQILKGKDGSTFLSSLSIRLISLQNSIPSEDYLFINRVFSSNECLEEDDFIIEINDKTPWQDLEPTGNEII